MYLLDTDTCIYIINNKPEAVRSKFRTVSLNEIAISSITLFELDAGARKGNRAEESLQKLEQFASIIQVLPFDAEAARHAGALRQHLREQGTPIGDMDTLIAAHALSVGATVITNNLKEFQRVPELSVENWLDEM